MQLRLEEDQFVKEVKDMKNGDIGWIVPWGISIDLNGFCWINPNYSINTEKMGTINTKIQYFNGKYIAKEIGPHSWRKEKVPENYIPLHIT